MTTIAEILQVKGSMMQTIDAELSMLTAARRMVQKGVGSLAVMAKGTLVGLISERDIINQLADHGDEVVLKPVRDAMLPVVEIASDAPVQLAMSMMTNRRIRHLVVRQYDDVIGIVSIGDLVKATIDDQADAIETMHSYITGVPS